LAVQLAGFDWWKRHQIISAVLRGTTAVSDSAIAGKRGIPVSG
jgi:hypothetical protein